MLQFPLKLQETANGEFALQIPSKEVCGESRAAATCLQGISCGRAIAVSHTHAGLGTNDALDLHIQRAKCQPECPCRLSFRGSYKLQYIHYNIYYIDCIRQTELHILMLAQTAEHSIYLSL